MTSSSPGVAEGALAVLESDKREVASRLHARAAEMVRLRTERMRVHDTDLVRQLSERCSAAAASAPRHRAERIRACAVDSVRCLELLLRAHSGECVRRLEQRLRATLDATGMQLA